MKRADSRAVVLTLVLSKDCSVSLENVHLEKRGYSELHREDGRSEINSCQSSNLSSIFNPTDMNATFQGQSHPIILGAVDVSPFTKSKYTLAC